MARASFMIDAVSGCESPQLTGAVGLLQVRDYGDSGCTVKAKGLQLRTLHVTTDRYCELYGSYDAPLHNPSFYALGNVRCSGTAGHSAHDDVGHAKALHPS